MRSFLLFLTILASCSYVSAQQSAIDSVKATINTMFTAMKNGDEKLFRSVMGDSAVLQGITRNKAGATVVYTEDVNGFAEFIGTVKKDSADERIRFETVKVDANLAMAWTPYEFYHNGKFSHCGVNSFQLVRFDGIWKIQYIIDTRRKNGCL
ncbi:MAG: hypothetical protein EOO05_00225 [Chitinophagaceae bacterium]|nr:MAG: hypothetical protein EOO05_00225 [Chitinophagaceae bacterium]